MTHIGGFLCFQLLCLVCGYTASKQYMMQKYAEAKNAKSR